MFLSERPLSYHRVFVKVFTELFRPFLLTKPQKRVPVFYPGLTPKGIPVRECDKLGGDHGFFPCRSERIERVYTPPSLSLVLLPTLYNRHFVVFYISLVNTVYTDPSSTTISRFFVGINGPKKWIIEKISLN